MTSDGNLLRTLLCFQDIQDNEILWILTDAEGTGFSCLLALSDTPSTSSSPPPLPYNARADKLKRKTSNCKIQVHNIQLFYLSKTTKVITGKQGYGCIQEAHDKEFCSFRQKQKGVSNQEIEGMLHGLELAKRETSLPLSYRGSLCFCKTLADPLSNSH